MKADGAILDFTLHSSHFNLHLHTHGTLDRISEASVVEFLVNVAGPVDVCCWFGVGDVVDNGGIGV